LKNIINVFKMEKKVQKIIPALYATKSVKNKPKSGEKLVTFTQAEKVFGGGLPEDGFGKRAVIEDIYSYEQGFQDDSWGQSETGRQGEPVQGQEQGQGEQAKEDSWEQYGFPKNKGDSQLLSSQQYEQQEPEYEPREPEFIPSKTFKKKEEPIESKKVSFVEVEPVPTKKVVPEEAVSQKDPDYMPSELFMKRIKDLIEKNDLKEYKIYLQKIPLRNLNYQKTNGLLLILLKWLESSSFTDGLKHTLTYWSGMQTGFDEYFGDIFPVIPVLFLDPTIPFSALNYIVKSLSDTVSIEEIAIDLFEKGSGDQLTDALKKLFDIYGAPSGETYRILYDEAMNLNNETAIEFFSGLQNYFTEPVQKPPYVVQESEILEESLLLQIAEQVADSVAGQEIPSDDVEACVELLVKGFEKFNLDIQHLEKTKQYLRDKLENLSEEERIKYVYAFINQDVLNQLVENENLFNILGPSNPITTGDFTQTTHICYKYGGCRMYYCNCFEGEIFGPDNDDNTEPYYPNIPQWFIGKCQHCKREIEKRCYAVRRPLPQGGWKGTYCSWNCLALSGNGDDELTREKVNIYEKELFEKTIMNREEMNVEEALIEAKEQNPEGYILKVPNIG